jgi:hypothetical protein
MLEGLTDRLRQDIETFKHVMDAHDHARANYDAPPATPDPWAGIRATAITKTDWHIYDHCAAFTRLYAIYATYVDELIEEYLRILPTLYATYDQLPRPIATQHRLGLGLILGKLGEGGAYNHLDERDLIATLSHGLTGGTPYKLIKHAFLTDRQNYRLEVLGRLLGYLGIDNAPRQLSNNRALTSFLETTKPQTTTVESELDQFVKRRNEAAHTDVTDIVATEEVKQTADFILQLGRALAEVLTYASIRRRHTLGHFPQLGIVEKTYYQGMVVISHLKPCMIRIGDQLAIVRGGNLHLATITGLQRDDVDQELVLLTAPAEIGIRLDRKTNEGSAIHALRDQQTAPYQLMQVFEQRRDDIVDQLTDKFGGLRFITDHAADATLESIDSIELDTPQLLEIRDQQANLTITAQVAFTATTMYEEPDTGIDDAEETIVHPVEPAAQTVQPTVRVPVDLRFEYDDISNLNDPQHAAISIERVNNGNDIVFALQRPEEPT